MPELTGVEETPAAGGHGFTREDFVVPEEEAAEEVQEETQEEEQVTEPVEQREDPVEVAFAKRLKDATEKIRKEVRQEIMDELNRTQPGMQTGGLQQSQYPQGIPPLSDTDAEKLADQYGTTPEVVRGMYMQQAILNRQSEELQRIAFQNYEREEKERAKDYADEVQRVNPAAPKWDEKRLAKYRADYHKEYGVALTWRDAYRQVVADEALNPQRIQEITREAQQETIKKITSKDKETVQIQGQTAKKPSIDELSDAEFEEFLKDAEAGKFKA